METPTIDKELTERFDYTMVEHAKGLNKTIVDQTRDTRIWDALIPKSKLPEITCSLGATVYDRAIPALQEGKKVGAHWGRVGNDVRPPTITLEKTNASGNSKRSDRYYLEVANIKSPYVEAEVMAEPEVLQKTLPHVDAIMKDVIEGTQHRRLQECFERISGSLVVCSDETEIEQFNYNAEVASIPPARATCYLSTKVTDAIHKRLKVTTDHRHAYGMKDGEPNFALIIGKDASKVLQQEHWHRSKMEPSDRLDDKLREIRASIGSFRKWYHLTYDHPPRYTDAGGTLVRVEPYLPDGNYHLEYDKAEFEVAYAVHKTTMEYQVPSEEPDAYLADIQWLNIQDQIKNPDHTIGFFFATLAGAAKPLKVETGFTILFRRDSTTPADVPDAR